MASPRHNERRLQYRAETRKAVLEEAERLLNERGLEGFSMRQLASRCGCTAPTIYHYFRDKPGLIASVLEARLERVVQELRDLPPFDDPVTTLRSRAAAFALFGVRHPAHYQLLMAQEANGSSDDLATEELRRVFTESIQDLIRSGDLEEGDLEMLRQGIWSLVHGFILLQTTLPDDEWEPDLLDRSLDAMIRGSLRRNRRTRTSAVQRHRRDAGA